MEIYSMPNCCEILDWDSRFFGCRIGYINNPEWSQANMDIINLWIQQEFIDCLYILININDLEASRLMPQLNAYCVDVRLTFERNMSEPIDDDVLPLDIVIRPAIQNDVPILRHIAKDSYHDTRFYFDTKFDRQKCSELYQLWIERSCDKLIATEVLVALLNEYPIGYITCSIKDTVGVIGLVGVDHEIRGRGIGRQLVLHALRWFKDKGCRTVTVATQGRNVLAQRVYQRAGFLSGSTSMWYHAWFSHSNLSEKLV